MELTIIRARSYLAGMEAPVRDPGHPQDSHAVVFKAALALRHGFALPKDQARTLLAEYAKRSDMPWSDRELEHKLDEAARVSHDKPEGHLLTARSVSVRTDQERDAPAAPEPETEPERNWREFDPAALAKEQTTTKIGQEWLWRRSPVDVRSMAAGAFLTHVSQPGDRLLVFTNERSQGQYIFWHHEDEAKCGWYRLGDRRGVRARFTAPAAHTPADLMRARCGVWWLCQPVSGEWQANGENWSRRSAGNVTHWRTMVLESDEEGIEPAWLNLLVQLPLRIVALYTSGARSVHALIRVDLPSKAAWDRWRDVLKPALTMLGADKGVFSAVRLTRLPGCFRLGKFDRKTSTLIRYKEPRMQRLLYLNPDAEARPMLDLPVLRSGPMWEEAYA